MTVFANNLEVSCKAQANRVIASFPDVCMTPPETPATPPGVPVPYPNFGMDSDTDKGTGTVKIGGKTVNLKNESYFTKTTGDEAGCAAKKGVISSKNKGKAYSQAFSMNVKAESLNLTRFSDIQTDNHGSPPNVVPWPKVGKAWVINPGNPCASDIEEMQDACKSEEDVKKACEKAGLDIAPSKRETDGYTHSSIEDASAPDVDLKNKRFKKGYVRTNKKLNDMADKAARDPCLSALVCKLPKYKEGCPCPGQTGHHVVPASGFFTKGRGENPESDDLPLTIHKPPSEPSANYTPPKPYNAKEAPVICAVGSSHTTGTHGMMHTEMKSLVMAKAKWKWLPSAKGKKLRNSLPYNKQRDDAIRAVKLVFPTSNCDPACLKAQLDSYHVEGLGMDENTPLRAEKCGRSSKEIPGAKVFIRARAAMLRMLSFVR